MQRNILLFPAALALFAAGCDTTEPNSGPMKTDAFLGAQKIVDEQKVPKDVEAYYVILHGEDRANRCVNAMRAGLASMRAGHDELAGHTFDEAIAEVRAPQGGSEQAERTKSNFVADQEKWFKGESYERAALFFYRGLLYLKVKDYGNAAACFKQSNVQDITGDDAHEYQGDWTCSEVGLALASYKNGEPGDAQQALQRAAGFPSKQGDVPPPSPETNLLVVVEAGSAPMKAREGNYGEKLSYRENAPSFQKVEVTVNGQKVLASAPAENLFFQATHRGARRLDEILAGKAAFKGGTSTASTVLGAGALGTAASGQSDVAAGALGAAAVGTALVSAATNPSADARGWDNLPHSIYMLPLTIAQPGASIVLTGVKANGEKVKIGQVTMPKNAGDLAVVVVRAR